ncbi:MAG: tetratricopeptide repeat protein [Azospirillaceae bacterium]
MTSESAEAVTAMDEAVRAFLRHGRDGVARIDAALAHDPDLLLGHVARGLWQTLLGRRAALAGARRCLDRARVCAIARGTTAREAWLLSALDRAVEDDFTGAIVALEESAGTHPHDPLTLKTIHIMRFMLGDRQGMRQSTARALLAWREDMPDYGYLLGCHAFGLEETGDVEAAERTGRRAVEMEPEDAWGFHAVAHVMEVTGRPEEGVRWLERHEPALGRANNFAFHVFWHRALFHLSLGETARVLALYDDHIRAERTDDFRDIANAASLLWRLQALGVEVGERWRELADLAEAHIGDHAYGFADAHYLLALVGDQRHAAAERFCASAEAAAISGHGDQARIWRLVGRHVADAIVAYGAGDDDRVARAAQAIGDQLQRLGGSNVQRDVFDIVLAGSAARAGKQGLCRQLLRARYKRRGADLFGSRLARRADLTVDATGLEAAAP